MGSISQSQDFSKVHLLTIEAQIASLQSGCLELALTVCDKDIISANMHIKTLNVTDMATSM